jgi:hypothetical protein
MMNLSAKIKHLAAAWLLIATALTAHAQEKTKTIGNKPRSGSASSSFNISKGNQVGIKMYAGRKPVQLLQLNFDVENQGADSMKFKVNVYDFNDATPGENLVKQNIYGAVPKGKNKVAVNLEPYSIKVKGHILVAIEWIENNGGDNRFAIGLFNGGTWKYEDGHWKKMAVAGIDFNVLVRKLK